METWFWKTTLNIIEKEFKECMMQSGNSDRVERHGCIVCGKIHTLLVVYDSGGRMIDCGVTSPDGRRVFDEQIPLVACRTHTEGEVRNALDKHYPGKAIEDEEEG
jgi:hypothetical protein